MLKVNPAISFLIFLMMMVIITFATSFIQYVVIFISLFIVVIIKGLELSKLFRLFMYITFFSSLMLLYNALIIHEGDVILSIGFINIYSKAVLFTLRVYVRSILFFMTGFIQLYSTDSYELVKGIEYLFSPLKVFKIDIKKLSTTMMISLMFLPLLFNELNRIFKAKAAKGQDIRGTGILIKIKSVMPILIPLFLISFKKADDIAVAMDIKCYDHFEQRTSFYQINMRFYDIFAVFIVLIYGILIFMV